MRFKVGDFVRIRANADVESVGIRGDVDRTAIWKVTDAKVNGGRDWCMIKASYNWWNIPDEMLEPASKEKIVITSDGVETTARLYDGKNVVKKSIAKCCKEDKFDFLTGAEIAFERLVEPHDQEQKYYNGKVVCVKSLDTRYTVGKIYEVKDGKMVDESGSIRPYGYKLKKIEDYEKKSGFYKFIELVEE